MGLNINSVCENVEKRQTYSANLEEALSLAGTGWYNMKYCLVLTLFLVAAVLESLGYGYILPAAKCDLQMSDAQRGFIASVPYIGIVLSSFPWGYLVDTRGRKDMIIYSSLVAGGFGMLAGFMPEVISFTVCKFIASLCISCAAALPYTYIGEMLPLKYRDLILSAVNSLQLLGGALVSALAMGILPLNFNTNFGAFDFRPWRLLCILYSSLFMIAATLMSYGPESPKYLVSQNKYDEALIVLQRIYAGNTGRSPDDYPVKMLNVAAETVKQRHNFLMSLKVQTIPLLRRPYVQWLALNGFLLCGVFSVGNGLYIWTPDIINRVFSYENSNTTACGIIAQKFNQTKNTPEESICNDTIDVRTFIFNLVSLIVCAAISLAVSMTIKFMDKKILLISVFVVMGTVCLTVNQVTEAMVFAVLLLSLTLIGLAIGPTNAFAIDIFPTHLRGMAVSLAMMVGRAGSAISANITGVMINAACEATFYFYGGLLMLCACLSLLMPRSKNSIHTNALEARR